MSQGRRRIKNYMRRVGVAFVVAALSNAVPAATPPLPYALNLAKDYPEYGSTPPPDICEEDKRSPCVMRTGVLYRPVADIETIRNKLNPGAWSELRRAAPKGQETWIFNVCMDKMREHPNCFGLFGVAVLNQGRITFYAFFKPKTYPD